MSYARRGYAFLGPGYASDVYVYHHTSGEFCCDDCPRLGHHFEPTALTMAIHLIDDRAAGYTVQQDTIDALIWEAENQDAVREQAERHAEWIAHMPPGETFQQEWERTHPGQDYWAPRKGPG